MNREANRLLNEAYEKELTKLRALEPDNEEFTNSLNRISTLRKMMQDERQSNTECLTKIVTCLGGIGLGIGYLRFQKKITYDVLKFEETGTIASTVGRNIIGNWLKFKTKF